MSRCLDPQTPPDKAFREPKHLLTRYLEDIGRLGYIDMYDIAIVREVMNNSSIWVPGFLRGFNLVGVKHPPPCCDPLLRKISVVQPGGKPESCTCYVRT